MVVVRNVKQYQKLMSKRADALRRAGIKTGSAAATFMQSTAIKLAPSSSGETVRGIRKTRRGRKYFVTSKVIPKGRRRFMQNMWANRTVPHRSVLVRWGAGRKVVYGDGSHNTTGTPRFFHFATLRSRKKFRDLGRRNTRAAMRVTI